MWCIGVQIGQKWILEPLFSEIYIKIELFSSWKHNSTSAPIAQLAEHLTFFIWFWPDQTWPERAQIQFPVEEHDFFSALLFFKHFLYAFKSYIDKLESKVLGSLCPI